MRKLLAGLFAASLRHCLRPVPRSAVGADSAGAAKASRRLLDRPVFRRLVRRISPPVHRRARADGVRDSVPQRLSKPCRDRNLPGPFDHPHRRSSCAHRDHRQCLDRSDGNALRQERLLRARMKNAPGSSSSAYKVSPKHLLRADAGRSDEGALARQPQRRCFGQGPRRGDDDRPQGRSALVLDRQKFETDLSGRGSAAGRGQGQCRDRRRACSAREALGRRRSAGEGASDRDRGRRQAGRRPVGFAARSRRRERFRAVARARRHALGARRGPGRRDAARPRRRPDVLAISLSATDYVGHAYGTEGRRCASSCSSSIATSAISWRCSTAAGSTMRSR